MSQKHSRMVNGGRAVWLTERLWKLSAGLEIFSISIDKVKEFEQNCWFGPGDEPTCRAVAEHARQIADSDLSCPIILSSDGRLMDGGHRIAKAWLMGLKEVNAVKFKSDPDPDCVEPIENEKDIKTYA